ncbi:DUF2550 family protein [Nocardioides sp. GY 10113]|uniref:DUF2550 domain-containing protein n=1 Tax=Nocardioides sp. GY 10113 TaxID=2569761 RepID=UPI0010A8E4F6|nr:DUF2550 domain-containing protein [Nocardioides sp. GY 10113]TIC88762.1 DUF2550 family protein [Nocardioides sp. GY 10113]
MHWWEWLVDTAGVVLLLALGYGAGLIVRRRLLARNGGTFELSHRLRMGRPGRGWVLGLGRYSGERLEWFRIFSLSPRPRASWARSELSYVDQRTAADTESNALFPDHLVIECSSPRGPVELAMSASSLTGFQAWLEARPPGTDWNKK